MLVQLALQLFRGGHAVLQLHCWCNRGTEPCQPMRHVCMNRVVLPWPVPVRHAMRAARVRGGVWAKTFGSGRTSELGYGELSCV